MFKLNNKKAKREERCRSAVFIVNFGRIHNVFQSFYC